MPQGYVVVADEVVVGPTGPTIVGASGSDSAPVVKRKFVYAAIDQSSGSLVPTDLEVRWVVFVVPGFLHQQSRYP